MGAMNVSASSTEIGVALKAPAMVRRQLLSRFYSTLLRYQTIDLATSDLTLELEFRLTQAEQAALESVED